MAIIKEIRLFFRMKNLIVILIISLSSVFCRNIVVKMATLAPEGSEWHGMLIEMGQEWKRATNGLVKLRIYPGGVVGDERDMIRKMRIGQIHSGAVTTEGLSEIAPEFVAFYIPLAFKNDGDIQIVLDSISGELNGKLEVNGFKLLHFGDLGWVYWFSNSKILTPQDLKSKKIFTWAGDFKWAEIYKKAGYTPVPLASTDLLSGLQTGLVNSMATMPLYALSQQSFGIANHMLDLKWGALLAGIIIDMKTWNRIPSQYHDELIIIAKRIGEKQRNMNKVAEAQAIQAMKEYGLQVHTPSEEEKIIWRDEINTMEPFIRGNVIPSELYDRVIRLTKEK